MQARCVRDGPKSGGPATTLAADLPQPSCRPANAPGKAKAGPVYAPWPAFVSSVSRVVGRRFSAARLSVRKDGTVVRIYSGFYTFGFSLKAHNIPLIPSAQQYRLANWG